MCIDSHKQMTKAMFKRFENSKHFLCYYSVKDEAVRNEGHARRLYTEADYFSAYCENYLNHNYEDPFQRVLNYIDNYDFEHANTSFPLDKEEIVKRFMYCLVARSPGFLSDSKRTSDLFRQMEAQRQHDTAAIYGTRIAQQLDLLNTHTLTLVENETSKVFVLPTCGIYSLGYKKTMLVLLPVSPKKAIALLDKRLIAYSDNTIQMPLFSIDDESLIDIFNMVAFRVQCNEGDGYVVANEEGILAELKTKYKKG